VGPLGAVVIGLAGSLALLVDAQEGLGAVFVREALDAQAAFQIAHQPVRAGLVLGALRLVVACVVDAHAAFVAVRILIALYAGPGRRVANAPFTICVGAARDHGHVGKVSGDDRVSMCDVMGRPFVAVRQQDALAAPA